MRVKPPSNQRVCTTEKSVSQGPTLSVARHSAVTSHSNAPPKKKKKKRKFDLIYFLDWNSEFQPSSIWVTTLHLAKLADMTGTLPALAQINVARMCTSWWSSNSTPAVMWWKWTQSFGWCRSQGTNTLQMDRDKCCPK
jgi:hypothetical protein